MCDKTSKKSILDFFKPKVGKPVEEVEVSIAENENDLEVIEAEVEVEETEDMDTPPPSPPVERSTGRPTRACANRAREAWNGREISSSDSDDDFIQRGRGSRKRGRLSTGKRGKQTTLSRDGSLIHAKSKDEEKKTKKKKVKLDPETEAFLRSGVPDIIKKAKAKSKSLQNQKLKDEVVEVEEKSQDKRRTLDAETLAFLHSGVPESVLKTRQSVNKRKEQDESLTSMGFFPKTSHTCYNDENQEEVNISRENFPFSLLSTNAESSSSDPGSQNDEPIPYFLFSSVTASSKKIDCLSSQDTDFDSPVGFCCEENPVTVHPEESTLKRLKDYKFIGDVDSNKENLPWIELMKVTNTKNLVVDKSALETLTGWLRQWRKDIRDDGGTSRKLEKKRKRGGNSDDSDFITSNDEESEMKKKSLLLTGPSGCGKTAAVYVLAKHYDFEVVEVNFSSRRPGKEVLQRVEEAVLSHRLRASKNCLLLFKDIDLLHPEEDEGFFSAVAQLITCAVRPIVMTSCLPVYSLIDSKLDKKDPLRISFSRPRPTEIVDKVLKPILTSTKTQIHSKSALQVDKWLDSIVRHSGCDIRQCINQLQLLLSTSTDSTCLSNEVIHLYSSPFQRHLIDLNFPRQSNVRGDSTAGSQESCASNDDNDDDVSLSLTARKKRCISQLRKLAENLEIFSDLDWISCLSPSHPTRNVNIFGDVDEAIWHWNHVSGMRSPFFTRLSAQIEGSKTRSEDARTDMRRIRELVLESDAEIDKWMEIDGLNDEIGQYLELSTVSIGSNWENCAAVRTIVKNNMLDSVAGRVQKRNGRMASYFNRIDKTLRNKITETFGFQEQLELVKLS